MFCLLVAAHPAVQKRLSRVELGYVFGISCMVIQPGKGGHFDETENSDFKLT